MNRLNSSIEKSRIRKLIKDKIQNLQNREHKDILINNNLQKILLDIKPRKVLLFQPLLDEPNINPIIDLLKDKVHFYYADYSTLSYYPKDKKEELLFDFSIFDTVLIPGRAFDLNGNRIGRGGGWYDQALKKTKSDCNKIGICYNEQIFKALPHEDHDQPVNYLISDSGINKFDNL